MPEDGRRTRPERAFVAPCQVLVDGGRGVGARDRAVPPGAAARRRAPGREAFEPVGSLDVGDATYVAVGRGAGAARSPWRCRSTGPTGPSRSTAAPRPRSCATRTVRSSAGWCGPGSRCGSAWSPTVEQPESPYAVSRGVRPRREPHPDRRATPGPDRPAWLRRALVAAHQLLEVEGGRVPLPAGPAGVGAGAGGGLRERRRLPGARRHRPTQDGVVLARRSSSTTTPSSPRRARPRSSTPSRSTSCSAFAR